MNILMLAPIFYPHIGGVEKHVKRLSEELIKRGDKVSIITIKHDQNLLDFKVLNGIKVYRFTIMHQPKFWLWFYKHRKLIMDADLIHCHDFGTFIHWYLPFRFIFPFKPVFVTFHGYEGIIPIPQKILYMRRMTELLTKGNICIGDYIPKWYGTKATFISYGGVDVLNDVNETNSDGAVFIGRLEKDTGIVAYIDAIRILKTKYRTNIKVDICANGRLRETIEKTVRENELNVRSHGFVDNPLDYLVKSKFAFVSGYLAILEAMITKKLVFAVYENELKKDYLTLMPKSKDMMVIVSSPEELAEKIAYYYNNPEKTEEIVNAAYNFARKQTWEKVADAYLRLWSVEKWAR